MSSRSVQTDAFVLRTVDYGESHIIVTLLGRDLGKFSAIARSARKSRKRFVGGLLPLRALRATVTFKPQRDLAELDAAQVHRDYPGLDLSYEKITIASYCTELVRASLRDHDQATPTFDLLDDVYGRLATAEDTPAVLRAVLHHFELGILGAGGAAPSLDACHRCGTPTAAMDKVRCGRDGQGVVCAACVRPGERSGVLERGTVEVLAFLQDPDGRPPAAIADDTIAAQVRRVIDVSLATMLDGDLKSRPLVDAIFSETR